MGSRVIRFSEHLVWSVIGVFSLVILGFAILHLLKQNAITGGVARWVGEHASNY